MTNTTEHGRIISSFSGQEITNTEVTRGVILPEKGTKEFNELFPVVDIEWLFLNEPFMNYLPKTANQRRVKRNIKFAKRIHMENFRRAALIPYFTNDGNSLMFDFEKDERPAFGKTPEWWEKSAKAFMPQKNSRLGSFLEYDVFLGTVIKNLVKNGNYSISEAWKITCDGQLNASNVGRHSKKAGKHARHARGKSIYGEKIRQILKDYAPYDYGGFYIAENYLEGREIRYTASIYEAQFRKTIYLKSVGWIVLNK